MSHRDEKKPVIVSPNNAKIHVFIRAQNGGELVLKVKPSTPFSRIANGFCKTRGLDPKTVRFLSDRGQRLMGELSIGELDLDMEEDENGIPTIFIDAMTEQIGGGGSGSWL